MSKELKEGDKVVIFRPYELHLDDSLCKHIGKEAKITGSTSDNEWFLLDVDNSSRWWNHRFLKAEPYVELGELRSFWGVQFFKETIEKIPVLQFRNGRFVSIEEKKRSGYPRQTGRTKRMIAAIVADALSLSELPIFVMGLNRCHNNFLRKDILGVLDALFPTMDGITTNPYKINVFGKEIRFVGDYDELNRTIRAIGPEFNGKKRIETFSLYIDHALKERIR